MRGTERIRRLLPKAAGFIENFIITTFIVMLVFTYIFRTTAVLGSSMSGTLNEGDRLIVTSWYGKPSQGDIVVINARRAVILDRDGNTVESGGIGGYIVKRIIATEGQSVDIDFERGTVSVDGEVLDEPYANGLTHRDDGAFTGSYPVTVPEGYVFVMGDNRTVSEDSRSYRLGFVSEDDIEGKVVFRFSPLKSFGIVH